MFRCFGARGLLALESFSPSSPTSCLDQSWLYAFPPSLSLSPLSPDWQPWGSLSMLACQQIERLNQRLPQKVPVAPP